MTVLIIVVWFAAAVGGGWGIGALTNRWAFTPRGYALLVTGGTAWGASVSAAALWALSA